MKPWQFFFLFLAFAAYGCAPAFAFTLDRTADSSETSPDGSADASAAEAEPEASDPGSSFGSYKMSNKVTLGSQTTMMTSGYAGTQSSVTAPPSAMQQSMNQGFKLGASSAGASTSGGAAAPAAQTTSSLSSSSSGFKMGQVTTRSSSNASQGDTSGSQVLVS